MNARISFLIAAAGLLAGCSHATTATRPADNRAQARSSAQSDAALALEKGMTTDEVEKLLGKPDSVRPFESPKAGGKEEVWVYSRVVGTNAKMEATGVEERPYVDPFTGEWASVPEPVYSRKLVKVVEELQLLWYDGKLISWKRVRKGEAAYY